MTSYSQHSATDQRDLLLARVLDEFEQALKQGRAPSLDDVVAQYPELKDELPDCLTALLALHRPHDQAEDASESFDTPWPPAPGTTLGDFLIGPELGRGGMGVVVAAEQRSLRRSVALKLLPNSALLEPKLVQRFKNEAAAAAQLQHPHIVPVYSFGEVNGTHFYAMKLIEGPSLSEFIRKKRRALSPERPSSDDASSDFPTTRDLLGIDTAQPGVGAASADSKVLSPAVPAGTSASIFSLSPDEMRTVVRWGLEAAEGIEHAHAAGIVHRDIKPSNLLLDQNGAVWITDFGLALLQDSPGVTASGDVIGTLRYMSPEQAAGSRFVDQRADVYGLCATLYELLCLRPVVPDFGKAETLQAVLHGEPRPLRAVNPRVPRDLETIVMKGLSRDPASRFQSMLELADDLTRFLEDRPILARRPTVVERGGKWVRRHRLKVVSALLAVVMTSLAVAAMATRAAVSAREHLYETSLLQARAERWSGRPGQAHQALAAIQTAAQIQPSMALRNEALAALSLFDMQPEQTLRVTTAADLFSLDIAPNFEIYAEDIGQGRIELRRVADQQRLHEWASPDENCEMLRFTPDSRWLACTLKRRGSRDMRFIVWNVESKAAVINEVTQAGTYGLGFSADGQWFAKGFVDGRVRVFDLAHPEVIPLEFRLEAKAEPRDIEFAPPSATQARGPRLAASVRHQAKIEIWDLHPPKLVRTLSGADHVAGLAWIRQART